MPLNNKTQGGRGDVDRTLAVCNALLDDREALVVKAMSWALRELAIRNPKTVSEYIAKWREALAPRVQHKLRTGLKHPKAR